MSPAVHREKASYLNDSILYELFPFFVSALDQQSAISESLQQVIVLIGTSHSRASLTEDMSLARMTAARSSSLVVVSLLSGATLVLEATNLV